MLEAYIDELNQSVSIRRNHHLLLCGPPCSSIVQILVVGGPQPRIL